MIAIALAGQPELLVADEPTTALDVTIQAQILTLLAEIRRDTGMALVLISHDLGVIAETCERVCVMYAGRIVEETRTERLFAAPSHPYAQGLMAALPPIHGPRRPLAAIPGSVPEPWAMPPGCAFAPRCPRHVAACDAAPPPLVAVTPGHCAACIRPGAASARAPSRRNCCPHDALVGSPRPGAPLFHAARHAGPPGRGSRRGWRDAAAGCRQDAGTGR
ncbi:oligopeptide/dipeptide ABC transporter ATP-binding protein [Pseudoroseomonas wenyumeiae]